MPSISISSLITGFVNVLDFGADPTGNSDSSSAFSAAITRLDSGGIVFVPAGSYILSSTVTVPAGTTVVVASGATVSGTLSGAVVTLNASSVSAAAGANNGTSPPAPAVVSGSTPLRGRVTFGSGATPAAGKQVVVSFGTSFAFVPAVAVIASNSATQALGLYVTDQIAAGFTLATTNAPAASQPNTTYGFNYVALG